MFDPVIEDWPGFGVWKSNDDPEVQAAAEECSQEYGPDQVYAYPGNYFSQLTPPFIFLRTQLLRHMHELYKSKY